MTTQEMIQKAKELGKKDILKFISDMEEAGLEVRYYEGRYFWKGPAVSCGGIDDVLQETKVKCKWDSLGRGAIVHPCESF